MTRTRTGLAVVALAFAWAAPAPGQIFLPGSEGRGGGAENIEGIAVVGKGTATARPDRLEIDLEISAASELTADAIVKYRDAKKRLEDAFAALKLEDVKVEERGLLVDQKGQNYNPYMFDMSPSRKAKAEVQLTRKLVVVVTGIRTMEEEAVLQLVAKLLDVAQDAGGKVGGGGNDFNPYIYNPYRNMNRGGMVRFVLDDLDAAEETAYERAMADADARARRLAKLGRATLGPVTAIREADSPAGRSANGNARDDDPSRQPKTLETPRYQEIPVRVELVVRYELKPQAGAAAPAARGGGQ